MSRRAIDPLITLTAGLLLLTGDGFLLLARQKWGILEGVSSYATMLIGLLFFLTGLAALSMVAIPTRNWKSLLVHFAAALSLGILAILYAVNGLWVEAALLGGMIAMLALLAFRKDAGQTASQDPLTALAFTLNLAVGIGLLASAAPWQAELYETLPYYRFAFSAVFLAAAGMGGVSLFGKQKKRILSKLTAVPWLAWSLFFVFDGSLPSFLPAICFAIALLLADHIPWARLKLPAGDLIGHRLILLSSIVQTAFLIVITYLLNEADVSHFASMGRTGVGTREMAFLMMLATNAVLTYGLVSLIITINGLVIKISGEKPGTEEMADETNEVATWRERVARLIGPFTSSEPDLQTRFELQAQQVESLNGQLEREKRRTAQFTLLSELSQQLENQLDAPVAAQLAVNTLQRSLDCTLVALYLHEPERHELVTLAAAGTRISMLPPGYRQSVKIGILGRTARLRKTQVIPDSRLEPEFLQLGDEQTLSTVAVPLIDHGHLKAMLEISDDRVNAFNSSDIQITEAVAMELLRAWERSEYHQRLTELIQAGISLTTQPDPQAAVQEVANIARQTLRARFTFVTLLDQEGNFTRTAFSGYAPRLLKTIGRGPGDEPLMQAALNAASPFRVRDIRKYKHASHIDIDSSSLRSLIAIPIRMHRLSVGAMLAFGKQGEVFFTENDESLASLLSSQAAAAIESAWLSHELRNNLTSTTQLYQLSFHVIQAEELTDAAHYIADAAQRVCAASSAGILLLTTDKKVEAEVQLNSSGEHVPPSHPMEIVKRAMESGQSIFFSSEDDTSTICFPLQTPMRTYGALWLILPDRNGSRFATNLQTLANQAAVALERSILLVESRQRAKELAAAYLELETTYDHTLAALMSALDARDRETEGHSLRVAQIALSLGRKLNLSGTQLKALERGSLLHDIGKIGISDTILHKPGPLSASEWEIMRLHPDIGARIVEDIPFLQDTLAVVRYHQERWDGSGYPIGLSGRDIPHLARIFAVADAFDALTSDRPYRTRIQPSEALQYLHEQAGILFDPEMVQTLEEIASQGMLDDGDAQ